VCVCIVHKFSLALFDTLKLCDAFMKLVSAPVATHQWVSSAV